MKIQSCSLLVDVMTSLQVIIIPLGTSRLSFLVYLSEINIDRWRQQRRTQNDSPTPHLFFRGVSKTFDINNSFFKCKNRRAAPKTMCFDTCQIFVHALSCAHSVEGNNQYEERTITIASTVLRLSSSYTDPFLIAVFSRIG